MIVRPNFYSYSLTPEEEAICAKVGYERQLPMMGKPEKNRNYSEGDVYETWQHAVCAGSELAFARMCGLQDFVPHVNKFKSESDVAGYEIRYTFGAQGIRLSTWDDKEVIYVLLVDGLRVKTRRNAQDNWLGFPYRAVCWAQGQQIIDDGQEKNGYWFLPKSKANKMETL